MFIDTASFLGASTGEFTDFTPGDSAGAAVPPGPFAPPVFRGPPFGPFALGFRVDVGAAFAMAPVTPLVGVRLFAPDVQGGPPVAGPRNFYRPFVQRIAPVRFPPPPEGVALVSPPVLTGPPLQGPRNFYRPYVQPSPVVLAPPAPNSVGNTQLTTTEIHHGPPHGPYAPGFVSQGGFQGGPYSPPPPPPGVPPPPPPPPGPPAPVAHGRGHLLPFVPRDPSVDERVRAHTHLVSTMLNSLLAGGFLVQTGATSYQVRSGGLVAPRAPTATDDATVGAIPGMSWVDTTNQTVWFCVSNAVASAVWKGPF